MIKINGLKQMKRKPRAPASVYTLSYPRPAQLRVWAASSWSWWMVAGAGAVCFGLPATQYLFWKVANVGFSLFLVCCVISASFRLVIVMFKEEEKEA